MRVAADITKINSLIVIQPYGTTAIGWSVGIGPCRRLPVDASRHDIAAAVLDALKQSQQGRRVKGRGGDGSRAFLIASRLRSWKDYDPRAVVTVDRDRSGNLRVVSFKRDGPGHSPVPGRATRVRPNAPMDLLARAIERAIEKSEAHYVPGRSRQARKRG